MAIIRKIPNYIPIDLVLELIGQFEFTGGEQDVDIAEQIASNSYSTIEDCLQTIKGCITKKAALRRFDKDVAELKTNPYFKQYFTDEKEQSELNRN